MDQRAHAPARFERSGRSSAASHPSAEPEISHRYRHTALSLPPGHRAARRMTPTAASVESIPAMWCRWGSEISRLVWRRTNDSQTDGRGQILGYLGERVFLQGSG